MPFALVTIGLIMIITGAQATQKEFGAQLVKDFSNGAGCNPLQGQFQNCGFVWWVSAIVAVGALGYVESLRTFSRAFMALIIIGMVIANRGVFDQLQAALTQGPKTPHSSDAVAAQVSQGQSTTASNDNMMGDTFARYAGEFIGSAATAVVL